MRVRYFAWVRERIGRVEEEVAPPETVRTLGDLIEWLATRGEEYRAALAIPKAIRGALDHHHATHDTALGSVQEVALFPPMTGG